MPSEKIPSIYFTIFLVLMLSPSSFFVQSLHGQVKQPPFINVHINPPFKKVLLNDPLLMQISGAKIIRLKSGKTMIVGVASTNIANKSVDQRVAADRILRVKADREIIQLTGEVQIAVEEIIDDKTVIVIKDGKETAQLVERYREIIKATITQKTKSLPFVGRWYSADGDRLFYAVGAIIDEQK